MTPRNVLETIGKDEVIGPLMLDELHRTGHSRFPVIDGDIDHVIGVLHIKELLTLREKPPKRLVRLWRKRFTTSIKTRR